THKKFRKLSKKGIDKMLRDKKTYFLIIIITVGLILSACGTEQSASNTNNDQAETDNQANNEIDEDEAFDVHGVKLNVKEEPEDIIEAEYDNDPRDKGVDTTFTLTDERKEEIIKAIIEQDEETFRKHNYFGDRVLDQTLKQTVYTDITEEDVRSDDPMVNEDNSDLVNKLSEKTFKHANEYIKFRNKFEAETNEDLNDHIESMIPEGNSKRTPILYRTEDVFDYAEEIGLTDIDLNDYKIHVYGSGNEIKIANDSYKSNAFRLEEEGDYEAFDRRKATTFYIRFSKYKDGYYYINGIEFRDIKNEEV